MSQQFFNQLENLVKKEPAMKNSVENIKQDWYSEENVYGNINEDVQSSICENCSDFSENETDHLFDEVSAHSFVKMPGKYEPVTQEKTLKRLVSLTSFAKYHISIQN